MWLTEAQFYIFGGVYMSARIALNSTATMLPLYLTSVTQFKPKPGMDTSPQIASVPLVQYICSLLFSVCLQAKITQRFRNRLIPMIMAVVTTVIGSVPLAFLDNNNDRYIVYPCAALQGVGIALMLSTGTSLISDVIGTDNRSSAFVYGAYSLFDKFSNGFLLFFLVRSYSKDATALKYIMAIIPSAAAIGCALLTWIGIAMYAEKLAKISAGSVLKTKQNYYGDKEDQALIDNQN